MFEERTAAVILARKHRMGRPGWPDRVYGIKQTARILRPLPLPLLPPTPPPPPLLLLLWLLPPLPPLLLLLLLLAAAAGLNDHRLEAVYGRRA